MNSDFAFDLLHPAVKRQLWDMKWSHLRPIQVESIRAILCGNEHLIVSAATASGKTEAAFLPVLSKIADDSKGGVKALYVGPLKALINDQFQRVNDLCGHLDVAVHHWHGDVPASNKKKLIERPGGVLLITPESLESLFVNRSPFMQRLFGELKFVVIDELHSFLGNERGLHLRSLLCRIQILQKSADNLRLIGLSATIGDPSVAQRYVRLNEFRAATVIDDDSMASELKLRLHGYREIPPPKDEDTTEAFRKMTKDLVKHCRGAANLVFANAKAEVEELADLAGRIGNEANYSDRFLVHHGSLSAEMREDTEAVMKSGVVATAFCSSTLEMGIDIGSVKMVGQVGTPWSVTSLQQRLGRSGRREGDARLLRMYVRCEQPDSKSNLFDRLHLELIQGIALIELMLRRWVEPPAPPICDLSTLTQQIMSVVCQTGGARADAVFNRLCVQGAFREIDQPLFVKLLRQLVKREIIDQMPEGDIILGLKGEQIRKDKGFYAVFETPEEFAVLNGGQRIGNVSMAPQVGDHFLLAGRRWQVLQVDQDHLEIYVHPAQGWQRPQFNGGGGEIRPEIRKEMKAILSKSDQYSFLDSEAVGILEDARAAAKSANLAEATLVPLGPSRCALMTWTGTKIQATLQAMLTIGQTRPEDVGIALIFKASMAAVRDLISHVLNCSQNSADIARRIIHPFRRKYDWLLSEDLAFEQIERAWVDVAGAISVLKSVASTIA